MDFVQPVKKSILSATAASSSSDAQLLQSLLYRHYKFCACHKHVIIGKQNPCMHTLHTVPRYVQYGVLFTHGYNSIITSKYIARNHHHFFIVYWYRVLIKHKYRLLNSMFNIHPPSPKKQKTLNSLQSRQSLYVNSMHTWSATH